MAEPAQAYLLDTNVLLRLYQPNSPEFSFIRRAVNSLHRANAALYYLCQNIIEFWNVSTRPVAQNGYGLSPAETEDSDKADREGVYFATGCRSNSSRMEAAGVCIWCFRH
jgi:hypothetical protein